MKLTLAIFLYFAVGLAMLGCVGGRRSRLQWDGSPRPLDRMLIVLLWPLIVLHAVLG